MKSRASAVAFYMAALVFAIGAILDLTPAGERDFGELLPCVMFFCVGLYHEALWRAGW